MHNGKPFGKYERKNLQFISQYAIYARPRVQNNVSARLSESARPPGDGGEQKRFGEKLPGRVVCTIRAAADELLINTQTVQNTIFKNRHAKRKYATSFVGVGVDVCFSYILRNAQIMHSSQI